MEAIKEQKNNTKRNPTEHYFFSLHPNKKQYITGIVKVKVKELVSLCCSGMSLCSRFSSRSPLKALRTPGRTALAALDPNTPQADLGSSPLLRRYRSSLRQVLLLALMC